MKRDTINYVLVGGFVVAMLGALAVLLFAVTGRSGPADSYFVYYKNVSGLKFGTGVFYEGYQVGQIEQITPERAASGMRYRVELSIASDWLIPQDSTARAQSTGLISAVSVHISEGRSPEHLQPGDTIVGEEQTDLFAVLNQVAADFRTLSQDGMMPLLGNVNLRVSELAEEVLRFRREELSPFVRMMHQRVDQEVISEVVELLHSLDATAAGLKAMVDGDNQGRVRSFIGHIDDVAINLNELVGRIELTRLQMNGVLASIGELVTENSNEIEGTMDAAQGSMEELEAGLRTINQHLGTILYNIEGSSRNLGEFTRAIRENPARLIRNSAAGEPE